MGRELPRQLVQGIQHGTIRFSRSALLEALAVREPDGWRPARQVKKGVTESRLPNTVFAFNQHQAALGLAGGCQASFQRFELIAPIDEDRRPVVPHDVNAWRRCVGRRRKKTVTATWLTPDEPWLSRIFSERSAQLPDEHFDVSWLHVRATPDRRQDGLMGGDRAGPLEQAAQEIAGLSCQRNLLCTAKEGPVVLFESK
jgi:hypothetical protein